MCFWSIFKATVSKSLPVVDRPTGRKFWGNLGPLSGFGKAMTLASFQDFVKCGSRRQWLNTCVRCTDGLLGTHLGLMNIFTVSRLLKWRNPWELTACPPPFFSLHTVWWDTDRTEKTGFNSSVACTRWSANVLTELLPSNFRRIHREQGDLNSLLYF